MALAALLLSGSMDKALKANGQLKKVLAVFSVGVICVLLLPSLFQLF